MKNLNGDTTNFILILLAWGDMSRKTFVVLFVLIVSGCRPTALWFSEPQGPPEFKLGWEDGCDTGLSAEDNGYWYRAMYGYKKRPEMMDNELYKNGWNEGFSYCRFTEAAQKSK